MKVPLPSNLRIAKQVASHPAAKSFATKVHKKMPAGTPSESAKAQADASAGGPSFESIGIKNTDIVQKSGVSLDSHQKVLVGSVLDIKLSNSYTVKGIKSEQTMDSVVRIDVGPDGKITRVDDRWNDNMPEGAVAQTLRKLNAVSVPRFVTVPKTEEEDAKLKSERESQQSV
ncbi:uncharacterized protein VDAG_02624 [Verticillium dahliae VdLs.17]|uniref:Uncharacterized protein n=1 Tax=Verticillium dahliae (strain VdLs.17 / ATCC MYA-4575 / FGSC 10137) TaxID=498257 RepID=G2WYE2_VERDV|nr:uncharacterized protein VDAG_02624 [Verticillium dahliae VdLs.17]EGY21100.1 hypothetical protein VDAG_02624 [Verticillium dahliae VdLs.17]